MSEVLPASAALLVRKWRSGEREALDELTPLVYDELRRLANAYLRSERKDHTLRPTALVHEAYLRLVQAEVDWCDRAHFFALAARTMRRLLLDHAKRRRRVKHGGGQPALPLDELEIGPAERPVAFLALDTALGALSAQDPRKGQLLELQIFGGLTQDELAEAAGISAATVGRELRLARAWIARELRHKP